MRVDLPEWVSRELGIEQAYDDEDSLRIRIEALGEKIFGIFDVDDFVRAVEAPAIFDVEFVPVMKCQPWRYAQVSFGGGAACEIVEIGNSFEEEVPSNSLRLILQTWFAQEAHDPRLLVTNRVSSVLLAWNVAVDFRKIGKDLVLALAGVEVPAIHLESGLTLQLASSIDLSTLSLIAREQSVYCSLLQGVIRNKEPALRYLYLYRLFERAYLSDALEKLQREFFSDPKLAIKKVDNIVSNEKNSFLSLIEATSALPYFEQIEQLFAANHATLANRFLYAVKQGAEADNDISYQEAWKRGCVLAYKVRCSIVHAGKSSPIFESFPDASAACLELNKKLMPAALAFLQLTAI